MLSLPEVIILVCARDDDPGCENNYTCKGRLELRSTLPWKEDEEEGDRLTHVTVKVDAQKKDGEGVWH